MEGNDPAMVDYHFWKEMCRMQISAVSPQNAAVPAAQAAPKAGPAPVQVQSAPTKDAAFISQKAKDMAAQLSGKTQQEEAKESPVVEANEEQGKK
jgi:hypothetical protein